MPARLVRQLRTSPPGADRPAHPPVLRAAVLELVEGEPRRRFPAVLHAGEPGRSVRHVEDPPLADAGLRADVALALLRRRAGAARRAPSSG